MTILVLNQERDLIWGYEEERIGSDHLALIRLHNDFLDSKVNIVEYNDGVTLNVLCIGELCLITNSDINQAAMIIKDALMNKLTGHNVCMQRSVLTEMFSQQRPSLQQAAFCCKEMINKKCIGTISGRESKQICLTNCADLKVFTRPGIKCSRTNGGCLVVDTFNASPYYEQIRYEAKAELPCLIEARMDGRNVQLKITNTLPFVLEDLVIKVPMIKSIEMKTIRPDNLLQKCIVDDGGLSWTISSLKPNASYYLLVKSIDDFDSIDDDDGGVYLSVEYEYCNESILVNDQPMMVKRLYQSAPCCGK